MGAFAWGAGDHEAENKIHKLKRPWSFPALFDILFWADLEACFYQVETDFSLEGFTAPT